MNDKNRPTANVLIVNRKGLHARASAKFVKCAENFDANITVTKDGQSVGGTSIMGLMTLGASKGTTIRIDAEGPEGPEALEALVALVADGFGEEN
ncbi:MAG: HPr family phosphocarrier protein [Hyphomicrobiales bacterium]|nr:HPr family phosphocarrier protein [Hyphomicrobiales bacterium]